MKVKINEKLLCIPPYISTTWDQVTFLQAEEDAETQLFTLAIHLTSGTTVRVPKVDTSLIDIAFAAHLKSLETKETPLAPPIKEAIEGKTLGSLLQQLTGLPSEQISNMPIRLGIAGMEGMPGMEIMQHDQAHANAPEIPNEILEKIVGMIKMVLQIETQAFPKPEPHCNCPHCQVSRKVHGISQEHVEEPSETPVSDEELKFKDWDIVQTSDKLFLVTNPLDTREHYNVFLGTPIGCTCGQSNCEHVKAVLYS